MSTIQQELWNIFTFYTLHGNPRDPSKMGSIPLAKLCKDMMVFDATMTERPLTQADLNIIFTGEIKKQLKNGLGEKVDRLNFNEFLSCLARISVKCYPSFLSEEESMQQLLMDNVLPLVMRRKPHSIKGLLSRDSVVSLFSYYEEALHAIFKFYSSSSDHSVRGRNFLKSTLNSSGKLFEEQRVLIEAAKEISSPNQFMLSGISYADFLRFASDYGFLSLMNMTTMEIGDIYLSVIEQDHFIPEVRNMEFVEFWEALVRCALLVFRELSIDDKIRSLFLSIWKHLQGSIRDSTANIGTLGGGGFNTYKSGLVHGSQLLNERFISAWARDNYRDYLTTPRPSSSSNNKSRTGSQTTTQEEKDLEAMKSLLQEVSLEDEGGISSSSLLGSMGRSDSLWGSSGNGIDERIQDEDEDYYDAEQQNNERDLSYGQHPKPHFRSAEEDVPMIVVDIKDEQDFGDSRIVPSMLRKLLETKPALASILFQCLEEEGLAG